MQLKLMKMLDKTNAIQVEVPCSNQHFVLGSSMIDIFDCEG